MKAFFITIIISYGSHGIANIITSLKLKDIMVNLKNKGIKIELEEVLQSKIPEDQNSAIIYNEIFKLMKEIEERYKTQINYLTYQNYTSFEKLKPEEKLIGKRIIQDERFKKIFQLTEKAVNMPYCRFEIEYEKGPEIILTHLSLLRQLLRYIKAKIYFALEDKNFNEVKKYIKIGLKIGDSLENEPLLISQLSRITIDIMMLKLIVEILNNQEVKLSKNDYNEVISLINNKKIDFVNSLNGEMIIFVRDFYENYMPSLKLNMQTKKTLYSSTIMVGKKLIKFYLTPLLKNDYCFFMRNFLEIIEMVRKPYYLSKGKNLEYEKKEFYDNKMNQIKYIFSLFFLPTYSRSNIQHSNYIAYLDTLKITLALKIYKLKYGEYPDNIEKIIPEIFPFLPIDPFTGKEYIYKKEIDGFLIYSLGENQTDDNGIYDLKKQLDDIGYKIKN